MSKKNNAENELTRILDSISTDRELAKSLALMVLEARLNEIDLDDDDSIEQGADVIATMVRIREL